MFKLFTEIEAELKVLIDEAKVAFEKGEDAVFQALHIQARAKAAEAGAAVSLNEGGVITAHDPAKAPAAPEPAPEPEAAAKTE
jgi:hypothetical protein